MLRLGAVAGLALLTANCASPPPPTARVAARRTLDSKYGVTASPRVVGENDPVPKGGGRELVGRPYVIAGRTYVPRENPSGYVREGLASWYGTAFHGRLTANGEIFDRTSIAAAHPTLPLPSYARVTNLANNRSMIVRVNDRGPYHQDRLMDVSERVAEALEFRQVGTAKVRVEYVSKASLKGSDDRKLLATLRMDGAPARMPGQGATMLADAGETMQRPRALAFRPPAPEEALSERAVASAPEPRVALAEAAPVHIQPSVARAASVPPHRSFAEVAPVRAHPALVETRSEHARPVRMARAEPSVEPSRGARARTVAVVRYPEPPAIRPTLAAEARGGGISVHPKLAAASATPALRGSVGTKEPSTRVAAPLPPGRPIDLETIPNAGKPVRAAHAPRPGDRSKVAGLL